jgi:hypothetical protein
MSDECVLDPGTDLANERDSSICPLTLPFFLCTKSLASVAPLLCAPFPCCHLIFVISSRASGYRKAEKANCAWLESPG